MGQNNSFESNHIIAHQKYVQKSVYTLFYVYRLGMLGLEVLVKLLPEEELSLTALGNELERSQNQTQRLQTLYNGQEDVFGYK